MTTPYAPLFPLGKDETPYRKLTDQGVRVEKFDGEDILVVEPEAIRLLAEAAMSDINHLLRPGHLAQLAKILDDPEATGNDKFVAFDLLKNANIAAGGVLPMCQDTGTAIVMGKKGRRVFTKGGDEAALVAGRAATPTRRKTCAIRSSRRSRCSRRGTPAPICPPRSISMKRARIITNSCSWPRAAARPIKPIWCRARPPC